MNVFLNFLAQPHGDLFLDKLKYFWQKNSKLKDLKPIQAGLWVMKIPSMEVWNDNQLWVKGTDLVHACFPAVQQ